MKAIDMCGINFQGKFIEPKNISKKAYKTKNMLREILHTKINGKTNAELVKEIPFDVFIYCKNPSKKAINPSFSFLIETEETSKQIGLWGLKHIVYSDENKAKKIRDFILNFNQTLEKTKGVLPFNKKQKDAKLAELIFSGFFN